MSKDSNWFNCIQSLDARYDPQMESLVKAIALHTNYGLISPTKLFTHYFIQAKPDKANHNDVYKARLFALSQLLRVLNSI